jgi:hypothetical protein
MANRKRTKRLTMIYRKLKIGQQELQPTPGMKTGAPKG